jgi:hypothetical protein
MDVLVLESHIILKAPGGVSGQHEAAQHVLAAHGTTAQ